MSSKNVCSQKKKKQYISVQNFHLCRKVKNKARMILNSKSILDQNSFIYMQLLSSSQIINENWIVILFFMFIN